MEPRRITRGAVKLPGVAWFEGFLYPLVATSLLLGVLLIWQRTYE